MARPTPIAARSRWTRSHSGRQPCSSTCRSVITSDRLLDRMRRTRRTPVVRAPAASPTRTANATPLSEVSRHAGCPSMALTPSNARARPITEPRRPANTASRPASRTIWASVAPRSRSRASSRRWPSASADCAASPSAAARRAPGIPSSRNKILALVASADASLSGSAPLSETTIDPGAGVRSSSRRSASDHSDAAPGSEG